MPVSPAMKQPNLYAAEFDRIGHRRRDNDWLKARMNDPASRFVPVWRNQSLVTNGAEGPQPVFLDRNQIEWDLDESVLLSLDGETAYFALDLSTAEEPLKTLKHGGEPQFTDLRTVGALLGPTEGALLAFARGMFYWHSRHRFCGICGHPTRSEDAGHVRRCTNPDCKTQHFPRTDPAVIMLVTDGDRCLLGRQKSWPLGQHSTLAGFVEPGESLEGAVAREVFEETGVRITDVTYHSSQPWPFPGSIMLGFHAKAVTTEITIDPSELEAARWYDRSYMLSHKEDDVFRMPRRGSIARRLVEDWLNGVS